MSDLGDLTLLEGNWWKHRGSVDGLASALGSAVGKQIVGWAYEDPAKWTGDAVLAIALSDGSTLMVESSGYDMTYLDAFVLSPDR